MMLCVLLEMALTHIACLSALRALCSLLGGLLAMLGAIGDVHMGEHLFKRRRYIVSIFHVFHVRISIV